MVFNSFRIVDGVFTKVGEAYFDVGGIRYYENGEEVFSSIDPGIANLTKYFKKNLGGTVLIPVGWDYGRVEVEILSQDEIDHKECFNIDELGLKDCTGDGWYRCSECTNYDGGDHL